MNTRHDNADGPEDIDKAFAEIVAGLERDTALPQWPDRQGPDKPGPDRPAHGTHDEQGGPPPAPHGRDATTGASGTNTVPEPEGPRDWTPHGEGSPADDPDDEGHFEPPEPPPVPTPRAGTVGGVALIVFGVALLLVPGLAGWAGTLALPVGLVAISAGIGWLLFRMRQSPPDSGWDDGAQL